ncbi:hypothetical protein DIS24_g5259 [Lasiodiplodia hormozganensis]|uniref:Uncharacterized protein n=1 Tax=Lasiodiplodia hormozganensis TaxID=869390 RepID=A0AA40CYZ4_9PEZI|nr:hypothetical protein DIS24_g5259 [Lasiodiplodia hormozganensis]
MVFSSPLVQTSEEEFREFGRKHFPGEPQPTFLPSFVTPSANPQTPTKTSPYPAIFDTAYNAGFTSGASFGHAAGYAEGYNAALAQLGIQTAKAAAPAEPDRNHMQVEVEDQVHAADGEAYYEEEEDLGFYSDGAKRTIDDEDIQFYRRSELMQMLKDAKRRVAERKEREAEEQMEHEADLEAETEMEAQKNSEAHEHDVPGAKEYNATEQANLNEVHSQTGHDAKVAHEDINPDEPSTGGASIELTCVKPDVAGSVDASSKIPQPVAMSKAALGEVIEAEHTDGRASTTQLVGDESCKRPNPHISKKKMTATLEANRGKKRKRITREPRPDDDGITYRRIARELDEMPSESVELDY